MTGRTTGALRVVLAALLLALARAAAAAPDPGYAEALIAKAHRLGLARDPHWLRLGHWRKYPLTGYRSDAAGSDFFVDPHGRTDPTAELEADLRAFFGASEQPAEEV